MPDGIGVRQVDLAAPKNIAQPWYDAGCSVIPIIADGTKRPTRDWKSLMETRLTQEEVNYYWHPKSPVGVALICGRISGNLEMTELEASASDAASLEAIRQECRLRGIEELWNNFHEHGYVEWTPSGGYHFLYRISDHDVPGNTKLASVPEGKQLKTLAETRGEGGYVIVAPSGGECHPTGQPWSTVAGQQGHIPTITWSQRQALHSAITAAVDQSPPPPPAIPKRELVARNPGEVTPVDDFNLRASWHDPWFTREGWQVHSRHGEETFWTRPGKDRGDGHSASTGYKDGTDNLYVWSTSAGLETEVPLSKFYVYAQYYHNGDMSAAARDLRMQGYGFRAEPEQLTDWQPEFDESRPIISGPKELTQEQRDRLELYGSIYDPTDTGNALRMFEKFGDSFLYVASTKIWYEWSGVSWSPDKVASVERAAESISDDIMREARDLLLRAKESMDPKEIDRKSKDARQHGTRSRSASAISSMMKRFAGQKDVTIDPESFDADINFLNLRNGVLDLSTMEVLPHDPKYLATKTFGSDHVEGAECPRFRKFMEEAFPDPSVAAYIQRALGYSLLGQASERAVFILHGPSGTGKSVLTNTIMKLFGGYGDVAPASTFRKKRNDTSTLDQNSLRGKRYITTSELPEGAELDEELLKRLTGADAISSRDHYEAFTSWTPQCVIFIATNHLPRLSQDDNALWRRVKTIPMTTEFAETRQEIPNYTGVLLKEAEGIFNWLLEGLGEYRAKGLDEPPAITAAVEDYRNTVDSVASFVRDMVDDNMLVRDPEGFIKLSLLSSKYADYCRNQRSMPLSERRLLTRLEAVGLRAEVRPGQGKIVAGISATAGSFLATLGY